jgi:hypothetical protein
LQKNSRLGSFPHYNCKTQSDPERTRILSTTRTGTRLNQNNKGGLNMKTETTQTENPTYSQNMYDTITREITIDHYKIEILNKNIGSQVTAFLINYKNLLNESLKLHQNLMFKIDNKLKEIEEKENKKEDTSNEK